MAKVKVRINPSFSKKLGELNKVVDDNFAAKVGNMLIAESKNLIASGQSPVKGVGRFEAYKEPAKYPGDQKPSRPVNLYLTGLMLSFLNFRRNGQLIDFGIIGATSKVRTYAKVHNDGNEHIAQRRFLPTDGEGFTVSIMVKMKALFKNRVLEIIRKLNKKK